jgi:serine/threonine-protein kinase HipA
LGELTYLLASGSDRSGALDFQASPTEYKPRLSEQASLELLIQASDYVEKGNPLPLALDQALMHGTSLGGARPKAQIEDGGHKYVAKFPSSTDIYSVVKAEFISMRLAEVAGLNVAPVKLVKALGRDILLIKRFDRRKTEEGWQRKAIVSGLTLLELDELMARYASYEQLAEVIRHRFTNPKSTLREMFARMTFNILCSNTDDHARNHAAFWDGSGLSLTPAYDICPQPRTGNEATQAMLIHGENRFSRLDVCLKAAPNFLLSEKEARSIMDAQIESIHKNWNPICDQAELSKVDRNLFWKRQFLNPYATRFY